MMQLRNKILLSLLSLLPLLVNAQAIDNTLSFKNINSDKYFRGSYENDLVFGTDGYYSQGMQAELVAPWVKDFPFSKVLVHPRYHYIRYGLGIEHDLYTPSDISVEYFVPGNRPYTSCLFLKTFLIAIDTVHKQRFSTTLSTGVIGPAAGGMEMQTVAHRYLHDIAPHGWQYQIHNDAILNYQVDYEKQLLSFEHIFSLDADGIARAGTLSDKAGLGATVMIGYFDSPFGNATTKRDDFRMYVYEHPEVDIIGYDATLQGGVFDNSSPYIITADNITRFTFQNRIGIAFTYHRLFFEGSATFLSPEFKTGTTHQWGSLQVAWGL